MKANTKLLIANRGEIARRILKAGREKGLIVGVITTKDDENSLVCTEADVVLTVDSFLNAKQIVQKAKEFGAHLLHPGYGFLSENSAFAKLCEDNKIAFIGPTSAQIKALGSKESSKNIARECHVPVLSSLSSDELKQIPQKNWKSAFEARGIFSPYLVKASGGGGGRGMRIVKDFNEIPDQLKRASDEALQAFNDATVFVERYLSHPRHIEIQVFGDGKGGGAYFGERECSLQRRHQKVLEESPSVIVSPELRSQMGEASLALVAHTKYRGAGTVEFLLDEKKNFFFLEVNTRLQVEHPVTELVYDVDLVHAQIDLALGHWPFAERKNIKNPTPRGVALEARILAEDPRQNFMPTPGAIEEYKEPSGEGIRVDSGVQKNSKILSQFDSMISKLIVHAPTRAQAVQKLQKALEDYVIFGITTNIPFLIALTKRKEFLEGNESTHFIEENLTDLNQSHVSKEIMDFLNSQSVREKLFGSYYIQKAQQPLVNVFSSQKFSHVYSSMLSSVNSDVSKNIQLNLNSLQNTSFLNSNRELEINLMGERIVLEHPAYYHQSFSQQDESYAEIKAPMAGKVYEVRVKENQTVEKGDILFILESMKMQIEIRAPISGIVKNLFVRNDEILLDKKTLCIVSTQ